MPLSYGDMLLLLSAFGIVATGIIMRLFKWWYDRHITLEVERDTEQEYSSWSR